MRSTFLPSISPFPSPVDSVFTRSQSAWESKSLVKSSRRGSGVAGSPARTAAMIRRDFKGLLRRFLLPAQKCPAKSLQRGYQSPGEKRKKRRARNQCVSALGSSGRNLQPAGRFQPPHGRPPFPERPPGRFFLAGEAARRTRGCSRSYRFPPLSTTAGVDEFWF